MKKIYLKSDTEISMIRHIVGALNDSAYQPFETTVGEAAKSGFFSTDQGTMTWSAEVTIPTSEMKCTSVETTGKRVYVEGFEPWEQY